MTTPIDKAYLYKAITFVIALFLAIPTQAKTNILFIFDGSNSMWGQIDNTAKIETARKTLSKLVTDLPADTSLGLMAYGHKRKGDCNDVELLSAIGKNKPEMIKKLIHKIQPTGKTPIAHALEKSKDAFKGLNGQNNHILLVSDGIESCGGDPCSMAKTLQVAGLDVSAHVIGFGVSKEEGKQLDCIAKNTGGKYFDAANAVAFNKAIEEVTQIAKAEPEPKASVWFEDNFDGEELGKEWEVTNPNPDAHIVEDGKLLLVSGKTGTHKDETIENFIKLNKPMPKGDWVMTMKFSVEYQSSQERPFMALYQDPENYIEVLASAYWPYGMMPAPHVVLESHKVSKGAVKSFAKTVWLSGRSGAVWEDSWPVQPIILKLEKKGRSYRASAMMTKVEKPVWVELNKFTLLRSSGTPAIGMYQATKTPGETTGQIDWIKIETTQAPKKIQPVAAK